VSDVAGWAATWTPEEEREWTQRTRAQALFRDLDGGTSGNAFLKKMRLLPDALVSTADDRSTVITAVRRPSEAGDVRTYCQLRTQTVGSSYTAPSWEVFVMTPPGVVINIPARIISVHYIRIHFGYAPGTHIQNEL